MIENLTKIYLQKGVKKFAQIHISVILVWSPGNLTNIDASYVALYVLEGIAVNDRTPCIHFIYGKESTH